MKEFQHLDWTQLKEFRESLINPETGKRYQQKDVAKAAGMTQGYLARIESGQMTSPSRKYVEGIAAGLGITLEKLEQYIKKRDVPANFAQNTMITYTHEPRKIKLFRDFYEPRGFKYSDGVLLDNPAEVPCPPQLDKDTYAYALELPTNTMQPRYMAGDTLYVTSNPNLQPRAGDDVVLMFEHEDRQIAIVREVATVSGYGWGDYVEDGYAHEQNRQIRVMALNAKMRHMRNQKTGISRRPEGVNIPPDGKIAEYYIDDVDTENSTKLTDGPFSLDGSDGVHVHLVVGSWRGRRQHHVMQAASSAMTAEVGKATVTVTRANED